MEMEREVGFKFGNETCLKSPGSKYSERSKFHQNSLSSSSFLNLGNLSCFFIKLPFFLIYISGRDDSNFVFMDSVGNI